nr:t-complex polypeptide 1 homolog (peak 7 fraction) - rabbit (fragments) [Oryctolagus cuniculus]
LFVTNDAATILRFAEAFEAIPR